MNKGAHKKKNEALNSYLPFLTTVVIFLIGLFLLDRFWFPELNQSDQGSEVTQIPEDVKEALNHKGSNNVLGVNKGESYRIPILMYHYVEYVKDRKDTIRKSLNITPAIFDAQLKTMKEAGYTFLTASDLANIIDGSLALPNKSVVLTFDDGYRDFYTDAFPLIKKYQVKAVAYIIPGFLNQPNNLDDWQLKEIVRSGLVEIGAHTVHHAYLTSLNLNQAKGEIYSSKLMLEQQLNIPVMSFAYPYGAFNLNLIKEVRDEGFRVALSAIPGYEQTPENRFFLYRLRPGARVGKDLLTFLGQK